MIAVCPNHHHQLAGLDDEFVRNLKCHPYLASATGGSFPWLYRAALIRIGDNWAIGTCRITSSGSPLLHVRRFETRTTIDFSFYDAEGQEVVSMSENTLSPFDSDVVHDLEIATSGRSIKIWHGPRNVGFEFACARVTPRHLERQIRLCEGRERQIQVPTDGQMRRRRTQDKSLNRGSRSQRWSRTTRSCASLRARLRPFLFATPTQPGPLCTGSQRTISIRTGRSRYLPYAEQGFSAPTQPLSFRSPADLQSRLMKA